MKMKTAPFTWSVNPTPVPSKRTSLAALTALCSLAFLNGCQTAGGNVAGVGEAGSPSGGNGTTNVAATQIIRFDPEEFVGYSPDRVLPVLGAPDFVRRDGKAQIWQYRATNCILDLFLYQAGTGSQVKHAELRSRAPGAEALDACYSRMRQERKTKPPG
jgi:hypothetical protein